MVQASGRKPTGRVGETGDGAAAVGDRFRADQRRHPRGADGDGDITATQAEPESGGHVVAGARREDGPGSRADRLGCRRDAGQPYVATERLLEQVRDPASGGG